MGKSWIVSLCLVVLVQFHVRGSDEQLVNTYTISSVSYPSSRIGPYDWRHIRVDLPPWFSSMSLAFNSDFGLDLEQLKKTPIGSLALICFREGSLPLPDIHSTSEMGLVWDYITNDSFIGNRSLQNFQKCYPMQESIQLSVTNEQIFPGTWYFGIFNGIGPLRTQSKMINRGDPYSFSVNISVEGCTNSMMLGKYCNQTVNKLSCNVNHNLTGIGVKSESYKEIGKNVISCGNANGITCHENGMPKVYSLDAEGIGEELVISVANLTFNTLQNPNVMGSNSVVCYARYGGIPLETVYDFSGDISKGPLVIRFPKAGLWYITIQSIDRSTKRKGIQNNNLEVCYLLEWLVLQCPVNKAGLNCTSERYMLQAVIPTVQSAPLEFNYLPTTGKASSSDSDSFHLEPLLSNFSSEDSEIGGWTYFVFGIPSGSAMGNINFYLTSDTVQNYEIYVRYGGLPSLTSQDYFYANRTSNSNSSMFFKIYESTEDTISFYLLYPKVGTWFFGMRQLSPSVSSCQTDVSFSIQGCPNECSSNGACRSSLDASGTVLYSYCHCDLDHGGFDCSVELVSHNQHITHSFFLIASNAAALLPAFSSLRNKALAEWVIFTCSGMASAVYHACDSGAGCVLGFHTLQFFDFWLSFVAVVSTFIYLTTMSEASKRTIQTIVSLLTALLAQTDPTRSRNIAIVMGLGALGLFIGWFLEFWTHKRSASIPRHYRLDLQRWYIIKGWISSTVETILKRYRWGYIGAGILTLGLAALAWTMETSQSYWIWHSLWHIFIYTCSFFFICSKPNVSSCETEETAATSYELTRQASFNENDCRREGQMAF